MSDEPPFLPDAEPAKELVNGEKLAVIPVTPPQLIIPKRMKRKKFIRTITLKEQHEGGFRETQIPATLRDAKLQQVIMATKLQRSQEDALDDARDSNRILSPMELKGHGEAMKQSSEIMMKAFGAEEAAAQQSSSVAAIGAAVGAGIGAGLSMIARGDPDFATALIAVTKSAKKSRKQEPIDITPIK